MNSRRAWTVFTVVVLAYLVAVLQRSSLGVAGVDAAARFEASAAALSSLAVLQVVVYAALQIPVGVLVDRLGPRTLLVTGAALMAAGQTAVALSTDLPGAVAGRVLVGAGDAATFVSALRIVSIWFTGRRVPQLNQWLGNLGQLGQVLSAIPFAAVLHSAGWTPAFLSAASLSVIAATALLVAVQRGPGAVPTTTTGSIAAQPGGGLRAIASGVRASLARPGTRLGFWSHFTTQSPGTVFALFWGVPFLVGGLGYPAATAGALLSVQVAAGIVAGPILGLLSARFPFRRSNVVFGIVALVGSTTTLVLVWPGGPPFAVVMLMLVALGIGGPGSLIGFDFARAFNPARSLGAATGIVNVGGFTASFVMIFGIGVVLDAIRAATGAELYSLEAFRVAFLVEFAVVGFGVLMLVRARRRTRRRLEEDEGIAVGPVWVALIRTLRRRRGGTT